MKQEELLQEITNLGIEIPEGVDIKPLHEKVNNFATGLKTSAVEKALAGVDGTEFINKFLNDNDFENVDQYKAFINNSKASTSELQEKTNRIETELAEALASKDAANAELQDMKIKLAFSNAGVTDAEKIEDFKIIALSKMNNGGEVEDVIKDIVEKHSLANDDKKGFTIGGNPAPNTQGKELTPREAAALRMRKNK